jgi:hypothetical protein
MGSGCVPRALRLRLLSTGGLQRALLQKLFSCQKNRKKRGLDAREFGDVARHVACRIASNQACGVFISHNEEADGQWVAFIATMMLWEYLKTHCSPL